MNQLVFLLHKHEIPGLKRLKKTVLVNCNILFEDKSVEKMTNSKII